MAASKVGLTGVSGVAILGQSNPQVAALSDAQGSAGDLPASLSAAMAEDTREESEVMLEIALEAFEKNVQAANDEEGAVQFARAIEAGAPDAAQLAFVLEEGADIEINDLQEELTGPDGEVRINEMGLAADQRVNATDQADARDGGDEETESGGFGVFFRPIAGALGGIFLLLLKIFGRSEQSRISTVAIMFKTTMEKVKNLLEKVGNEMKKFASYSRAFLTGAFGTLAQGVSGFLGGLTKAGKRTKGSVPDTGAIHKITDSKLYKKVLKRKGTENAKRGPGLPGPHAPGHTPAAAPAGGGGAATAASEAGVPGASGPKKEPKETHQDFINKKDFSHEGRRKEFNRKINFASGTLGQVSQSAGHAVTLADMKVRMETSAVDADNQLQDANNQALDANLEVYRSNEQSNTKAADSAQQVAQAISQQQYAGLEKMTN